MADPLTQARIAQAAQARQAGDLATAKRLLQEAVAADPAAAPALNSLGLIALAERNPRLAFEWLNRAARADPGAPPVWLNLAEAQRALGDGAGELDSLDRALAIEPYLVPALFRKGQALERLGRGEEAVRSYRAILATVGEAQVPDGLRPALAHARQAVVAAGETQLAAMQDRLAAASSAHPGEDLSRAEAYAEQLAGRRRVYQQQPTGGHFPYLPAIEFFDRSLLPWLPALEAATDAIRAELLALWSDDEEAGFRPYVAFDAATPANQWAELNHSPRWSAWFLWENGVRDEAACARCPATAAAIAQVPVIDIPGKSPSVMFSVLKPRTRIPAHTGTTNIRTTVHLPLVVPDGCGFRVGATTREWREGEGWAFDDTIEHEAWNDSDRPRAILILDVWNPLLSEAERAAVRAIG